MIALAVERPAGGHLLSAACPRAFLRLLPAGLGLERSAPACGGKRRCLFGEGGEVGDVSAEAQRKLRSVDRCH